MSSNSTWTNVATYYANRVVEAWGAEKISSSNDRTKLGAKYPKINNTIGKTTGPLWYNGFDIYSGVQLGPSFINTSSCMNDMISTAQKGSLSVCSFSRDSGSSCTSSSETTGLTCDTGWCSLVAPFMSQSSEPSSCSNNSNFNKSTVEDLSFFNDTSSLEFASLTVMVTVDASKVSYKKSNYVANMPDGAMKNAMNQSSWSGGYGHTGMTAWESGSIFSSEGHTFGYGKDGTKNQPSAATGALSAQDTVQFNLCYLGQTLQNCPGCVNDTCCDLLTGTRQYCFHGLTDGYCSRYGTGNYNAFSAVFQPFAKAFNVLLDKSGAICEAQSDENSTKCVMFNGIVENIDISTDPTATQFKYDANPLKDPTKFSSNGPTVGVPVKFSLMYSADGTNGATGSYLSQFINPYAEDSNSSMVASDYKNSAGFNALGAFWDRLNSVAPRTGDDAGAKTYTGFVQAYYAYAVTNCFLLSLYQLAPFVSISPMLSMFGLF